MNAVSPSAKDPTTIAGRTPSASPMCRYHVASQSNAWNGVISATRSKRRHSASTAAKSP